MLFHVRLHEAAEAVEVADAVHDDGADQRRPDRGHRMALRSQVAAAMKIPTTIIVASAQSTRPPRMLKTTGRSTVEGGGGIVAIESV